MVKIRRERGGNKTKENCFVFRFYLRVREVNKYFLLYFLKDAFTSVLEQLQLQAITESTTATANR